MALFAGNLTRFGGGNLQETAPGNLALFRRKLSVRVTYEKLQVGKLNVGMKPPTVVPSRLELVQPLTLPVVSSIGAHDSCTFAAGQSL